MTPTTRMHVLRRSREIVSELLTEEEKRNYQILSLMDEVIAGLAQRLEEEAKQVALATGTKARGTNATAG